MVLLPGCVCCQSCRVFRPDELPDSFELDVDFPAGQSWNLRAESSSGANDAGGTYRNFYQEIAAQSSAVSGSYSLSRLPPSSMMFNFTPDALWSYSSASVLLYAAYYSRTVPLSHVIYSLSVYACQRFPTVNSHWSGPFLSAYPQTSQATLAAGPKVTHYEKVALDGQAIECGYSVARYDIEHPVVSSTTQFPSLYYLNFGTTASGVHNPNNDGSVCVETGTENASLSSCALPLSWSAKLGVCRKAVSGWTITTDIPKAAGDIYSRSVSGTITGARAVTAGASLDLFQPIGLAQCSPYSK